MTYEVFVEPHNDVPRTLAETLLENKGIFGISYDGKKIVDVVNRNQRNAGKRLSRPDWARNIQHFISDDNEFIDPATGSPVYKASQGRDFITAYHREGNICTVATTRAGEHRLVVEMHDRAGNTTKLFERQEPSPEPKVIVYGQNCFMPTEGDSWLWSIAGEERKVVLPRDYQYSPIENSSYVYTYASSETGDRFLIRDLLQNGKEVAEIPFRPVWRASFKNTGWIFGYMNLVMSADGTLGGPQKTVEYSELAGKLKKTKNLEHHFQVTHLICFNEATREYVGIPTGKHLPHLAKAKRVKGEYAETYFVRAGHAIIQITPEEVAVRYATGQPSGFEFVNTAVVGKGEYTRTMVAVANTNAVFQEGSVILSLQRHKQQVEYTREGAMLTAEGEVYIPVSTHATRFMKVSYENRNHPDKFPPDTPL